MKSFALSLAFIMRYTATRKWPICLNAMKPESSIKVGLQSKINKLKRSEYQRGLTARLESSVTENTTHK